MYTCYLSENYFRFVFIIHQNVSISSLTIDKDLVIFSSSNKNINECYLSRGSSVATGMAEKDDCEYC